MEQHDAWTIQRLLQWTTDYLQRHGSSSARLDAEVLLAHARGCRRIELYTAFDQIAPEDLRLQFRQLVQQRAKGTPVAYLVGHREFFSLEFQVTPDVLIPRPETEFVVLALLDLAKKHFPADRPLRVADVGTGSGILAVCAARYLTHASIDAIDLQRAALDVARQNAARHGVDSQIAWHEGDLLDALPPDAEPLDFIISNPPYVSQQEWEELPVEVKSFEPRIALIGGPQGDELIMRLVEQAARRLAPSGWLIMEISPMLAPRVDGWFAQSGAAWQHQVTRDLASHPRVVQARLESPPRP